MTLFISRQVQTVQHYENSAYCFVTENLLPPNHLQQTACIPKLICYFRPQQLTFKGKRIHYIVQEEEREWTNSLKAGSNEHLIEASSLQTNCSLVCDVAETEQVYYSLYTAEVFFCRVSSPGQTSLLVIPTFASSLYLLESRWILHRTWSCSSSAKLVSWGWQLWKVWVQSLFIFGLFKGFGDWDVLLWWLRKGSAEVFWDLKMQSGLVGRGGTPFYLLI